MKHMYPKDITDCIKDCILAIFWPREDIISFLKNNGCTTNDLRKVNNYDDLKLNRAKIIDIVFDGLYSRDDGGLGQFRSMLQAFINWSHFDPYYFDKLKKLDKSEALKRISHLKQLQEIRDAKSKLEREQRIQKEEQLLTSRKTQVEIQKIFSNLYQGKDESGNSITLQQRGYLLEKLLGDICRLDKLPITEPFKVIGEQIDGAIKFDGENYIFEAKWNDHVAASDALYQFAYKVEGKMYGRGIFFSLNGFSHDSVDALLKGKALKTILIDGGDLSLVIEGLYTFTEMLDKKIKAAQTMGRIYVDIYTMKDKIREII